MRLNKKIILKFLIIAVLLGTILGYISVKKNFYYNGKRVWVSHASRMYDTSNPETAVNISDYIFIAKVNKILKTDYRNPVEVEIDLGKNIIQRDPYTIYEIEVVENLKGNLITYEPIEFVQYGGLNEDGKSYSFLDNSSLLKIGEYYLLMVGVLPDTFEIEISDNNRMLPLGNDIKNLNNNLIEKYKLIINSSTLTEENKIMSKYDINY